jgi:hypothetical protein
LHLWHPGTTDDPWWATECVANDQTLFTGGARGSWLDLTVLEGKGNGPRERGDDMTQGETT